MREKEARSVRIDFLTTTVWEYGGLEHPPVAIKAEQPTGRLITFPDNAVLTGTVINYTRDFPFVWDELAVAIAKSPRPFQGCCCDHAIPIGVGDMLKAC
jgi:small-conductance mechanosensitive channel